ncbi:MAG: arginase family protein [Pyrobaculum sp.]
MIKSVCRDRDIKLFGAPMEDTLSFRPGTRFGPQKVRSILPYLEYTTMFGNISTPMCDLGDIELLKGYPEKNLKIIENFVKNIGELFIMIGGEHTATLAALRVIKPNTYIHIDAHLDLRDEWPPGQKISHATFVRRAHEELDMYVVYIGPRAYDDIEMTYAKDAGFYIVEGSDFSRENISDALSTVSGRVYLSLDIDVLDPAEAPGVGTPEAGGLSYKKLETLIADVMANTKPVAVDIMEYSPPNDVADITAVKIVRLMLHMASLLRI